MKTLTAERLLYESSVRYQVYLGIPLKWLGNLKDRNFNGL